MKQRIMAIFLSLCMMIGLLPATAFAADGGELVIGDSPVIITDGGNSQGNLVYDEETASITASVGDGVETPVGIGEGEVVIVPECICATEPGSLTMITESQSLTTIDGEATLELEATYSPEECVLSDGSHGEYENISYEITKVMKNEQSMSTEQYADIAGNILTVYGDDNEDPYTVYVRAKCGDVEKEVYSDEIAITVNTFTSAFVSAFVSNAPEGEFYNADGELDISKGSIIITDDGYQVGENPLVEWSDSDHALTITGTSNGENNIIVQGGNPELTFNGVNITTTGSNQPAVLLYGGTGNGESRAADATIILQGDNNILKGNDAPAIQININAILTIEGDGILTTSTTANNSSAIGAGNSNAYAFTDDTGEAKTNNSYRQYGNLVIENGTVIARGAGMGSKQYTAGIGDSYYANFGDVTVNGGTVELYNNNSNGTGISGNNIEINGGVVKDYTGGTKGGIHSDQSFTMNGGTITGNARLRGAGTISITGGNIGGYYTGDVTGRVLTKLYFVEENGTPKADTEVTVAEGEETPWTAYTDENGVVTTYLASTTEKISVEISGQSYGEIVLDDHRGIVGASCTCNKGTGTLNMITQSQKLTTVDGEATLELAANYTNDNCVLPSGFHGNYEDISFEVTKVVKNDQYMQVERYTQIADTSLTVYGDVNSDTYTVYVRAKCGDIGAEVYSDEIAITVNTYESEASSDELDIARGSIVITDNGYTVGNGEPVAWGDNTSHALTITGTSDGENNIIVQGGDPKLTFKDVNITATGSNQPAVLLYGGTGNGESRAADATIILQGNDNILVGNGAPAIQININAILTIEGSGTLTTESNSTSAIGAGNNNAYAFTDVAGDAGTHNNYRSGGNLVIESGTVIARGAGTGSRQYIAGIGDSYYANFGNVTVNGGTVELYNNNSNGTGISGNNIEINGGVVKDYTGGTRGGIHSDQSFTMNGGTITGNAQLRGADKISITGGNIGGYYTGDVTGRVLTKLYFVETNGKPVANTEVTVTEGEGSPWTAYTDENGIITTYLADATTEISATIDTQEYNNISVSNHQALIGGTCSCSTFTDITWETGLPESITLHNLTVGGDSTEPVKMNYDVPAAQLVTDQPCNMPIHPSLPEIEYELSVTTKDGPVVGELSGYATFRNNHLTLLPGNAPYTVTLTAKAGDGEAKKTASHSIIVYKGETSGGETQISTINLALGDAVINYTADGKYTYSQGDTITDQAIEGTILITGFAADGSVTVNGGSPTLVINQNDPQDVWTIYSGENAENITLQPRTFNDKLRFGEEGSALAELSYVSATGKLKLNPDQGNITFNTDDSVTQGKFIITQLNGNITEYVVMGGDIEVARTVTNNSSALITLEINGESVELAANGGSHSIPKADNSQIDATTKTYLFGNGDGTYTLIAAGEGDADASNYGDTQSKITAAIFDRDFTGRLRADNILYDVNLSELHAEQFSDISVKGSMLGHVYIGPNMTNISWGNYCMTTGFTVDPDNPAYTTDESGALYSKDYSTLVVLPSQWTGSYTTHEDCTTIGEYATMRLKLDSLTIGKNVQTIEGGSYLFFSNLLSAIYVEAGNQNFVSRDGILYDKEMTVILACPGKLALKELTVPETVTSVGAYIFQNIGIEKLIIPEGTEISGNRAGFTRMYNLKELEMLGSYSGYIDGAAALKKLTVYDGFNFAQNLDGDGNTPDSSMSWIKNAGITITGGENAAYDGQSQKVEVTTTDSNLTVEYSTDGDEWSTEVPAAVSAPGTYTVYWRITKPADETYNFDRVLYSSRTFTIGGLEASEDWFTLSGPVATDEAAETTPVTLNQPAAAPSLEGGYTVKYNGATDVPTTAGSYLVTVEITAEGYVQETLTLGNYVILSADQAGSIVISFVTNGGDPIDPVIATSGDSIEIPEKATRAGYTFAGWYSDSALRNKVDSLPATMPSENTTYYAKWTRDAYTITYVLNDGTVSGNPEGYTAETSTFTLKNPTKAGYEFTGWTWDGQDTPVETVTIEKGSSGDRVYTANWKEIEYTITYPKDYDKVSGNQETYTINDTLSSAISLTNPSREGYSFKGWTMVVDNSTSYILPAEGAEIPAGTLGNLTLSGIWLADNQTMTFHANGGKFADGTDVYVISGAYDSPLSVDVTNPTRSGYRFLGWFTDEECTQLFEASNIETMPLSMDIYAGWKKKSSSSSESTEGSGTSSVSDHVIITTNSGTLTDSQIEDAVKKAEKDSVITIQAEKSDEVVLSAGAMKALVENENDLLIQLRDGEVTLPEKAMSGLIDGAKSSYEIVVSLEEQTSSDDAAVSELLDKGAVVFDVTITVNGKEIHSFDRGLTLTFTVPGLKEMEEPIVLHLLQDGEQESYEPDEISGETLTIKGIKNLSVFAVLSDSEETVETENPFVDVFASDYYFNAVLWAVANGVTAGTSDITFSPDVTVSRAQMVTFLWRAAGSPAAEGSNPFTDVSVSDYYYSAVLWAVANGVTAGTSETTFSPDAPVSRAQAVTFQWRAAGGPAVSGESFVDIPEGAYYAPAVTWAVANGITSGTGDHQFSPDAPVSRAQAVTFLYRQYK
ncbi:InlB B-repeat-containing protein [Anaerotignum lactatifermentans]|nr:InlB B-repeat-containing protein [Anaerotignum lactatifermentans]MBM6828632.1 InlB B-repeat-containing protein [Anaerotignum lactatifermentans]MBM6950214.1 InlB B-repeat-containing protein [Anaerotignum lactatifermentans]